jgi:RNA polymerase sigma-70 factor (ECF subfamily)
MRPQPVVQPPPADPFCAAVAAELPRLRRFARVLTRAADPADDLVQETVLRALAGRHGFAAGGNLRAWLFVILRNARNAELRRARLFTPGPETEGVSGGQEERQHMRDVAAAFLRLPATQREVLWLVVIEGLDYAEAARILDIPIGTVRSRLSRAREMLRGTVGG